MSDDINDAGEITERYDALIANVRLLTAQPGVNLTRAIRHYSREWDILIGRSGVYSVQRAANDLEVSPAHLRTAASRARRKPSPIKPTRTDNCTAATENPHSTGCRQPPHESRPTLDPGLESRSGSAKKPHEEIPDEASGDYFVINDGRHLCRRDERTGGLHRWDRKTKKYVDIDFSQ